MPVAVLYLTGISLLVGAAWANSHVDRRPEMEGEELTYFPSGRMVSVASLGFDALAADVAFVRAVQYYGEHRLTDREFPWAKHLFDVIYDLDPNFITPYILGALVLAEDNGDLPAALEYLDRGQAANPDDWQLAFEAGFLRMAHGQDKVAAAPWFLKAMRLPGAPPYVAKFAAYCQMHSGNRELAIELWKSVKASTDDPALIEAANRYIGQMEEATDAS